MIKNRLFLNVCLMLSLILALSQIAKAQEGIVVSGIVTEAETKSGMVGVNVYVKGKVLGTTTDSKGAFNLRTNLTQPFTLVISMIGYQTIEKEITSSVQNLQFTIEKQSIMGQEVVISASRVSETVRESPIAIEKLDALAIRETPAANFYDGIANMKAVDMTTQSLTFKAVNARGFNSTGNTRFVQIIDGMDNQAPGLNFSVGNIVGISDLDVESVEFIPGAASALYGPNAFNGLMTMTSKSPFKYKGVSAMVRTGLNHIDGTDRKPAPLIETYIRYANSVNERFAYKFNIGYLRGQDWQANDTLNDISVVNPLLGRGVGNPGRDMLNVYGDEIVTTLPIGQGGSPVSVSRTGYNERDLVDYGVSSLKLDGALHYRINSNVEASYTYKFGQGTAVYQGANRYSIENFNFQQHKVEFQGANWMLRGYATIENSGDAFDSRFLAWNINRSWKSDQQWFTEYGGAFAGLVPGVNAGDHAAARAFADRGRLVPGTPEFETERKRIASQTDFTTGARFNDQSRLYHAEGTYNFKEEIKWMDVLVGGNYRVYDLRSNGTIFPDTAGNTITIYELGGFVQLSKRFLNDRLKFTLSGRYDKNENFDGRATPRFSVVYSDKSGKNTFRGSIQTGFRNPSTQEQFINLNLGPIQLIGGLPAIGQSMNVYNSFTLSSVQAFGAAVQGAIAGGMDASQAVINNRGILKRTSLQPIVPERVLVYEVGYKGMLGDKLYIDLGAYYNEYTNFIGFTRVARMNSNVDSEFEQAAFDVVNNSASNPTLRAFQVYGNASSTVTTYGAAASANYNLGKNYRLGINATYNQINQLDEGDDLVPGFNTPRWKTNVSLANTNLYKDLGFSLNWRYTESFRWDASFADGVVPTFHLVDLQFSYKLTKIKSMLKIGASNMLNNRHIEAFGGPMVGGMYYVSFVFDELLN